jgi:hypothetical protein
MAGPLYPDVPDTDGVPAVGRDASNSTFTDDTQMTSDSSSISAKASTQWGLYTSSGALALQPDNIAAVAYHGENTLADFPIEQGGFESYDKVQRPDMSAIRMTIGGKQADRKAFLDAAMVIKKDTELYSIVTPEQTYLNCNMMSLTVDRSQESGAGMIIAEMQFQEIRQGVTVAYSSTQSPASADAQNNGPTQTTSLEEDQGPITTDPYQGGTGNEPDLGKTPGDAPG